MLWFLGFIGYLHVFKNRGSEIHCASVRLSAISCSPIGTRTWAEPRGLLTAIVKPRKDQCKKHSTNQQITCFFPASESYEVNFTESPHWSLHPTMIALPRSHLWLQPWCPASLPWRSLETPHAASPRRLQLCMLENIIEHSLITSYHYEVHLYLAWFQLALLHSIEFWTSSILKISKL